MPSQDFANHIIDLLVPFGLCEARRMFGGQGIFREGLMIGLIADGDLYIKADDKNRQLFEDRGCEKFCYYKQGKPFYLSYYLAPEVIFDDEEELIYWANLSWDAALRAPPKKPKKTPR